MVKAEPNNQGRFDDVLERLVPIFSSIDAEIVFVACLDGSERVTEGEFFASDKRARETLPVNELFHLPVRLRSPGVLVATRAAAPIGELHERDVDFARRVRAAGNEAGVPVVGHFVIRDGRYQTVGTRISAR